MWPSSREPKERYTITNTSWPFISIILLHQSSTSWLATAIACEESYGDSNLKIYFFKLKKINHVPYGKL